MKVKVIVKLKQGVLDPQGKAVAHALQGQGFSTVSDVRVGKVIEVEMAETDKAVAYQKAKEMAEKLLANLVVEDYEIITE